MIEKKRKSILRWNGVTFAGVRDMLAVEEPLEIRLVFADGRPEQSISITMRTPGMDGPLAVGFLFTEGIIEARRAVRSAKVCEITPNVVRVELESGYGQNLERLKRHFYTSSSCGVCGKSSLESLQTVGRSKSTSNVEVRAEILPRLPDRLREVQRLFDETGGIHASGLFSLDGTLLDCAEDVGRHNALDKLIGKAFMEGNLPWRSHILVLSGRASFELVQKAIAAQIPVIAAVGAPSSLAVELADEYGVTLAAFVRNGGFNVYTHPERIVP
jgi:FdhD protein